MTKPRVKRASNKNVENFRKPRFSKIFLENESTLLSERHSREGGKVSDVAHPRRFERPTNAFGGRYSIQLSYGCVDAVNKRKQDLGQGVCLKLLTFYHLLRVLNGLRIFSHLISISFSKYSIRLDRKFWIYGCVRCFSK